MKPAVVCEFDYQYTELKIKLKKSTYLFQHVTSPNSSQAMSEWTIEQTASLFAENYGVNSYWFW